MALSLHHPRRQPDHRRTETQRESDLAERAVATSDGNHRLCRTRDDSVPRLPNTGDDGDVDVGIGLTARRPRQDANGSGTF